jgi:hypothetical protein
MLKAAALLVTLLAFVTLTLLVITLFAGHAADVHVWMLAGCGFVFFTAGIIVVKGRGI